MEAYIKRRRGTLRVYLEDYRPDLLKETKVEARHSKDMYKLLWWEQEWIEKDVMVK